MKVIVKKAIENKPKYKIGDIIVYLDRYEDTEKSGFLQLYQSQIVSAEASIMVYEKKDTFGWMYVTKQIEDEKHDFLSEDEILYKLN